MRFERSSYDNIGTSEETGHTVRLGPVFMSCVNTGSRLMQLISGPKDAIRFLNFIRRFWNQIFICLSVSPSIAAISIRRSRVRK